MEGKATMIPDEFVSNETNEKSREDLIYYSLQKHLPKGYYVFHSAKSYYEKPYNNKIYTKKGEADFVIFNPDKVKGGVIVIEAKYIDGFCTDKEGKWYSTDKKGNPTTNEIHYGRGPYEQAKDYAEGVINDYFKNVLKLNFPVITVVWFHKIPSVDLYKLQIDKDHTFSKDDLDNPFPKINNLLKNVARGEGIITDECIRKIKEFFKIEYKCFNASSDAAEERFKSLLEEQVRVLDFLEEQRLACIQGLAGTGKTVIAVEKAKRLSEYGKKPTLFLCYNTKLRDFLKKNNPDYEGKIEFKTIDSLINDLKTKPTDKKTLDDLEIKWRNDFPYDNVVIDETQDIVKDNTSNINSFFETIDLNTSKNDETYGSFYMFFDKFQCIQSKEEDLPEIIKNPECLLTLNTNCRNTVEIRKTSLGPLSKLYKDTYEVKMAVRKRPNFREVVTKEKPRFVRVDSSVMLDRIIDEIKFLVSEKKVDYKNIVILSVKGDDSMFLANCPNYDNNRLRITLETGEKKDIQVSTVRKFKGLESDAVILIDVEQSTFRKNNGETVNDKVLGFYVGCSRAKKYLSIISSISIDEIVELLNEEYGYCTSRIQQFFNDIICSDDKK